MIQRHNHSVDTGFFRSTSSGNISFHFCWSDIIDRSPLLDSVHDESSSEPIQELCVLLGARHEIKLFQTDSRDLSTVGFYNFDNIVIGIVHPRKSHTTIDLLFIDDFLVVDEITVVAFATLFLIDEDASIDDLIVWGDDRVSTSTDSRIDSEDHRAEEIVKVRLVAVSLSLVSMILCPRSNLQDLTS